MYNLHCNNSFCLSMWWEYNLTIYVIRNANSRAFSKVFVIIITNHFLLSVAAKQFFSTVQRFLNNSEAHTTILEPGHHFNSIS